MEVFTVEDEQGLRVPLTFLFVQSSSSRSSSRSLNRDMTQVTGEARA